MLKKFLCFIFIACMGTISAETIWERDPLVSNGFKRIFIEIYSMMAHPGLKGIIPIKWRIT